MRSPIKLAAALLLTLITGRNFAQYAVVDPQNLPAQIAQQETIVNTVQGGRDWHAWLKLAVLLQDASRYSESEAAYRKTLDLLKSPDALTKADVLDHMGTMYVESGQLIKAEPLEREALVVREAEHDPLGAGVSHTHLAMLLLGQQKPRSAEEEAQTAVGLLVPEYSGSGAKSAATPEEKMTALIDLSLAKCALQACPAAVPALKHALKIAHANYPDNSLPVGYIDFLLGNADWSSGDLQEAHELMGQGIRELATSIGWGHPTYLKTLRQYRTFLSQTGRAAEAQQISNELMKLDRSADLATTQSGPASVPPHNPLR